MVSVNLAHAVRARTDVKTKTCGTNFYFQLSVLIRILETSGDIQPEEIGSGTQIQLQLVLTAFKEKMQYAEPTLSPILE